MPADKVRLRIRLLIAIEYDADPESYGTADPAEMLAIDVAAAQDDPASFIDVDDSVITATGEVVAGAPTA